MKVYRNTIFDLDAGPLAGGVKPLLLGGAIIILALLFWSQSTNVLRATLHQNPLSLSANDSTILEVLVTNPQNSTVNNVTVTLSAPGSTQLSLYPAAQTIQTLGPQEIRKLEYLISPIDTRTTPFLPGTYRVDIQTKIGEKNYQTSVFVSVEK